MSDIKYFVLSAALALVGFGAVASAADARLDLPVISSAVCHVKGDAWVSNSLLFPTGCYAPLLSN